ncbi:hypothetical protein HK407_01g00010 [Ordospora pajunii]|uniref:uncharacterized protein n=1 Tax=Ordospora pajunii TaxID=3039483 RepID=UPI00295279AF|nr:uncharacterized protein HK407_01g00010 [Ordospora pajunii]KAH9412110.1 hypothetical protein HK407_01g00010 [Ordospora pajunii]
MFDSIDDGTLKSIMNGMDYNQKKSFLIELSESMEEPKLEPIEADTVYMYDTQEIISEAKQYKIDKVWRVYGYDSVPNLLLSMSDEEIKMVLKQLGHKHEIDALIYVGINKRYENADERNDDVKRIFDAIEDKQRNELLNDAFKNSFDRNRLDKLLAMLKDASVEYKKIAYMLLGVEDKIIVMNTIGRIVSSYGKYRYVTNILLSIDDDNDLGNMISKLKDKPELFVSILNGADDVDKLNRLFNIMISEASGLTKKYVEAVLDNLVINQNIVNELIDKPEDEQNQILGRINSAQLADKIIKCAIKEVQAQANLIAKQEAQAERREEHVKLIAAEEQKRRMLETTAILIILLVALIEALITGMSIKNALINGNAMNDQAVMAAVTTVVMVAVMLSVITYVKCANRPVWYDRLMIGGCVMMALVRVFMGVYGGVNVNEYVRMRLM